MIWLIPAAYACLLVAVIYRFSHLRPQLHDYAPTPTGPMVSIIIPARNEADNIEACVRSVLTTAYEPFELIAVDDRSTDETAAILERLAQSHEARGRLRVVRGEDLQPGWYGKPWAIEQGYRIARGELLLFTDADTDHTPELLSRAVAALRKERVGLVSVLSRQAMVSFWERLLQPQVLFALASRAGNLERINRTRTVWNAVASGQYILTTRADYEAIGRHASVRDTVVEDLALAQTYVRHGLDIFLVHGVEYMTTRMYRSLGAIVEGWSKNLALGVPQMFPPLPLVRRAAPWTMWLPSLAWIVPPALWALYGWPWAALTTLVSVGIWMAVHHAVGAPLRYALLYPLGAALVAYIMLRSAWRGPGKVEWRGRIYTEGGGVTTP